jgi:hypothetical protein
MLIKGRLIEEHEIGKKKTSDDSSDNSSDNSI